jgi:hypothetical protein
MNSGTDIAKAILMAPRSPHHVRMETVFIKVAAVNAFLSCAEQHPRNKKGMATDKNLENRLIGMIASRWKMF